MQMNYLPFKNFCKLPKRAETIRNYQKQVLVMVKHFLGNSQINSMPELRVFLHNFSLQNKHKSFRVQPQGRVYKLIIHSQREIKNILDPEKHTFSINSEHKVHRKALVLLLCLIPCQPCYVKSRQENLASLTIWATWQHPRESPRHVRGLTPKNDVRMAQFVLKIEKLSHGARGSQDLRSPSLIMAPDNVSPSKLDTLCLRIYLHYGPTMLSFLRSIRLASLFTSLSIFGWSDLLQTLRRQAAFSFAVLCIIITVWYFWGRRSFQIRYAAHF